MADFGVYVHYPWCRSRCSYCDFAVAIAPLSEIPHARYRAAILDELYAGAAAFSGRTLVSIYFGGGTPSLWPTGDLAAVIARVRETFAARGALEITLEANPTDCTAANLAGWRAAGITRLSIGAQSVDARELCTLGRDHRMGDGATAIAAAREAGFSSLSADFILGIPGPSAQARAEASIRAAIALFPEHLSIYELTVEPRTALARQIARGEVTTVAADALGDIYEHAHDQLSAAGYEHYEISSYARPGQRAVHNSLYWRGAEYLGLGVGAWSFLLDEGGGGQRWGNVRAAGRYLRGDRVAEREALSAADVAADGIWLGLRTAAGISVDLAAHDPDLIAWLEAENLARIDDHRILPTARGFLFADRVAARVLAGAGKADNRAVTQKG